MSLFKQLAGETIVYGFSHILGKVLNYVLIAFYLTRKLSGQQAEFAIYKELYFYVAIVLDPLRVKDGNDLFQVRHRTRQLQNSF